MDAAAERDGDSVVSLLVLSSESEKEGGVIARADRAAAAVGRSLSFTADLVFHIYRLAAWFLRPRLDKTTAVLSV